MKPPLTTTSPAARSSSPCATPPDPCPERILILGGVRSGKSRLAERLALDRGWPVTYLATATVGDDIEMQARVRAHRERRPARWQLIEEPLHLTDRLRAAAAPEHCVLVECLTLWLANLLWAEDEHLLEQELRALRDLLPQLPGRVIFVGNETNQGIIPMDALARRYCDLAGELHQNLARQCERVLLCVAGLPLVVKGPALGPSTIEPNAIESATISSRARAPAAKPIAGHSPQPPETNTADLKTASSGSAP